ncbi:SIS domain-containing protein [Saccharophagus sp. K07]|jgi:D-sedoheptulose 7-phosphate isomerase|uniref:D-sedoheptulose-7-phosphate isomerase n=1 Tax=Saccharophagus sp. K07 TaxID=2283636 RepID=UPI0016524296|nr:SIS domain-containing protein [Saccharophagus sp. K07]MBC6907319.1 SIS domain-containing protein [Saccharophagus sp. K07]
MSQRVYNLFQRSIEAKMQVGEELAPLIEASADRLVQALLEEKKILVCGNGPSSALAQIFTCNLVDRFEKERPGLPAIWLGGNLATYTSIVADAHYHDVYAKPLRALGQAGDILLVLSSSGNTPNLLHAIHTAHDRGLSVIALTGRDGGEIGRMLQPGDIELRAAVNSRSRIHEIHLLVLYCLSDLIDHKLFGIE